MGSDVGEDDDDNCSCGHCGGVPHGVDYGTDDREVGTPVKETGDSVASRCNGSRPLGMHMYWVLQWLRC